MNIEIDPMIRDQRRKVRQRFMILGIVLAAIGVVAWQWTPLLAGARGWRSRRLAAAAEARLGEKAYQEAFEQAQSAYFLQPDGAPGIAAVAKVLSATGRAGEAIPFWRKLAPLKSLTHEDRLIYANDLLRVGALPEASAETLTLEAEKSASPAVLRLAARLHAAQGRLPEALEKAQRSVGAAPGDLESQLLLALLLSQSDRDADRELGRRTFWDVSADPGDFGLQAMEALARSRDLPAREGAVLTKRLRAHPKAGEDQRLLALDLSIRLRPEEKAQLLAAAMAEHEAGGVAARRAFGVWLNAHGEPERALQVLPQAESFTRKDLLLVHIDALGALNRWGEVEELLLRPNVPLEEVYRQVFLARCALQKKDQAKADTHWLRARNDARSTPALLWFVGGYAEKAGQRAQAESAYRLFLENPTTRRPGCEALLRLAIQQGETVPIRDLLAEIRGYFPDDPAVENDLAYLNLLTGKDLEKSRAIAEKLRSQTPQNLAHRTTLALAQCLLKQPEAALQAYEGLEIPWEQVSMSQRAIHALVLGLNGKTAEAHEAVRALRLEALRPEEKRLIEPWIGS